MQNANVIHYFLPTKKFLFNLFHINYTNTFTYGSLSLPTVRAQKPAQFTKYWHTMTPCVVSTAFTWLF